MKKKDFAKCQNKNKYEKQCVKFEIINKNAKKLQIARDNNDQKKNEKVLC